MNILQERIVRALRYRTIVGLTLGDLSDYLEVPMSKLKIDIIDLEVKGIIERVSNFRGTSYWRLTEEWRMFHT